MPHTGNPGQTVYMVPALAAASWKDCGTHMAILAGVVPPPNANQEREHAQFEKKFYKIISLFRHCLQLSV